MPSVLESMGQEFAFVEVGVGTKPLRSFRAVSMEEWTRGGGTGPQDRDLLGSIEGSLRGSGLAVEPLDFLAKEPDDPALGLEDRHDFQAQSLRLPRRSGPRSSSTGMPPRFAARPLIGPWRGLRHHLAVELLLQPSQEFVSGLYGPQDLEHSGVPGSAIPGRRRRSAAKSFRACRVTAEASRERSGTGRR